MMDLSKYKEQITMSMVIDSHHMASILEQHREELVSEVERLQKLVNILTCCANCDHVYDSGVGHYCCKDHNKNSPLKENAQSDNCCPYWRKEIA